MDNNKIKHKKRIIFKLIIISFFFFILVTIVFSNPPFQSSNMNVNQILDIKYPQYNYGKINENQSFIFYTFNSSNGMVVYEDIGCEFSIYSENNTPLFNEFNTASNKEFIFNVNGNNFTNIGTYSYLIWCNNSFTGGFVSSIININYNGKEPADNPIIPAILIIIPILISIVFLFIASIIHEEHYILKHFLYVISIVPFFVSFNFGVIALVRFYNIPEMIDLIGTTIWWLGISFFVILLYFILYIFITAVHVSAQKKKARLNY